MTQTIAGPYYVQIQWDDDWGWSTESTHATPEEAGDALLRLMQNPPTKPGAKPWAYRLTAVIAQVDVLGRKRFGVEFDEV